MDRENKNPTNYIIRGFIAENPRDGKEQLVIDPILQANWLPESNQKKLVKSVKIIGKNSQGHPVITINPYIIKNTSSFIHENNKPIEFIASLPSSQHIDHIELLLKDHVKATISSKKKPRCQLYTQSTEKGINLDFMADCDRIDIRVTGQKQGGTESRHIFSRDGDKLSLEKQIFVPWEQCPATDSISFEAHVQRGLNYISVKSPVIQVKKQEFKVRLYCVGMRFIKYRQIRKRRQQRVIKIPFYQLTLSVKANFHGKECSSDNIEVIVQGKGYKGKLFQAECLGRNKVLTSIKLHDPVLGTKKIRQVLDIGEIKRKLGVSH